MHILGIETSCDETAAAIVSDGRRVRSNVVRSQVALHAEYGGVVPEIASRAHVEAITPVIRLALHDAGMTLDDIDAVAVANRPGLIGALLVGVAAAKALAWSIGKPLIAVDHIHAHLYAPLLRDDDTDDGRRDDDVFPALGLVVSGGHTSLSLLRSPTDIHQLGATIDDAVGEAFDKAAAILDLGYPGGPIIDQRAQRGDHNAHRLPISRLDRDSLDFSFSGLKTAILYAVRGTPTTDDHGKPTFERDAHDLSETAINDFCASFQHAAVGALLLKLRRTLDRWTQLAPDTGPAPRSILVGGGVAANSRLRHELLALSGERNVPLRIPAMPYCLDNAAMSAGLAFRHAQQRAFSDLSLAASPNATADAAPTALHR